MLTKQQLYKTAEKFISSKLDTILGDNPMLRLFKPTLNRGIHNQIEKYTKDIDKLLTYLEDKDGNIDIEGILNDTITQFETMPTTIMKHDLLGDISIGEGRVSFEMFVPIINTTRRITINKDDFYELIEMVKRTNV